MTTSILREALNELTRLGEHENEMLRRNGLVFDKWPVLDGRMSGPIVLDGNKDTDMERCTPEERWQAAAFTMHTNLWEAATIARLALEEEGADATP